MGYYDGGWGLGEWLAMSAMMLLFWGGLIVLVVWAVRASARKGRQADTGSDIAARPGDVLAERYARGEIDEEDFLRRREQLRTPSTPAR